MALVYNDSYAVPGTDMSIRIDEMLEEGGFSSVVKVHVMPGKNGALPAGQRNDEMPIYALKSSNIGRTDQFLDNMYEREVHFLAKLQDTGLVPRLVSHWTTQAHNQHQGHILMELFEGDIINYYHRGRRYGLAGHGLMPSDLRRMKHIARSLSARGIVHADLKTDQFLRCGTDVHKRIVVADFGLSGDFDTWRPYIGGWLLRGACGAHDSRVAFASMPADPWAGFEDDKDTIIKWFNLWQLEADLFLDDCPEYTEHPSGVRTKIKRFRQIPQDARELFKNIIDSCNKQCASAARQSPVRH